MYLVIIIIINVEEDINRSFLELRLDLNSPELELELELKCPELELELKLIGSSGIGIGIGIENNGIGIGIELKNWNWPQPWPQWRMEGCSVRIRLGCTPMKCPSAKIRNLGWLEIIVKTGSVYKVNQHWPDYLDWVHACGRYWPGSKDRPLSNMCRRSQHREDRNMWMVPVSGSTAPYLS